MSWYKKGDWNAICPICQKKMKASKLIRRWDGLMVCKEDWEPRHPQEFVRGVTDDSSVPFVLDEPTPTYVTGVCESLTDVSGYAMSGCAISGNDTAPPSGTFTI